MALRSSQLGVELRLLRIALGISVTQAAQRAQVAKSSWSNWENGKRSPDGAVLGSALKALQVDADTRARLLAEADPNYARLFLASHPLGPPVDIGQILRGMRTRAKMTQSQVASLAGVTQSAVAKWELGDSLPDEIALLNALKTLRASPSEIEWITGANHQPSVASDVERKAIDLSSIKFNLSAELREVPILQVERDAWQIAAEKQHYAPFIAALGTHAQWCMMQGRRSESKALAVRGMKLAEKHGEWDAGFACIWTYICLHRSSGNTTVPFLDPAMNWLNKMKDPFRKADFSILITEMLALSGKGQEALDLNSKMADWVGDTSFVDNDPWPGWEWVVLSRAMVQLISFNDREGAAEAVSIFDNMELGPIQVLGVDHTIRLDCHLSVGDKVPDAVFRDQARKQEYLAVAEPGAKAGEQEQFEAILRYWS